MDTSLCYHGDGEGCPVPAPRGSDACLSHGLRPTIPSGWNLKIRCWELRQDTRSLRSQKHSCGGLPRSQEEQRKFQTTRAEMKKTKLSRFSKGDKEPQPQNLMLAVRSRSSWCSEKGRKWWGLLLNSSTGVQRCFQKTLSWVQNIKWKPGWGSPVDEASKNISSLLSLGKIIIMDNHNRLWRCWNF